LTVIDFYSRLIVAFDVVPTVHAGHVKAIYQAGLRGQGISVHSERKPELRVDRGSPNTSGITQEFFEALGAELSFARVRRATDNALTERFYGTVKQEEIYLVGNYPDETSAREEIGRYIETYHRSGPIRGCLISLRPMSMRARVWGFYSCLANLDNLTVCWRPTRSCAVKSFPLRHSVPPRPRPITPKVREKRRA
jgi:transposase InsO family protein